MAEELNLPYHRKHRPNTLAKYIGNEKLKKTALASINKATKPQVILLEGASGCGKTTFARLIAMEYSCENRDTINGACGVCINCQEISEFIATGDTSMISYIKEINIADNSRARDLDEYIEDMAIPSFNSTWKIYILDECHVASIQQQNRLLKIVEEPPENVLIIFCTTNPENMLDTLVNRCQLRLPVKKPTVSELAGLLKYVCGVEQVDYDTKGLTLVASRSELTIRQALVNLERVVNEYGNAKYASVLDAFESVADSVLFDFFNKLIKRDIMGYVSLIHTIRTQMELRSFVTSLTDFVNRGVYILNNAKIEGLTETELLSYRNLFSNFSVEQIGVLLCRLLEMKGQDLELRLLMLGYLGLSDSQSPKQEDSIYTEIPAIENEITAENNQTSKNKEAEETRRLNEGLKVAEELTQGMNMDDVLSGFGMTMVKE